jgi:hypothetical protein
LYKTTKKDKPTGFFVRNTLSVKKFIISILVIGMLTVCTLAFPSTSLRNGEVTNTLYELVIQYNNAIHTQTNLAEMPFVQSGVLYRT